MDRCLGESGSGKRRKVAIDAVSLSAAGDTVRQRWLACRREFETTAKVAVCADGGRVEGKARLATCLLKLVTGRSCWAPPQDIALSPEPHSMNWVPSYDALATVGPSKIR